MSDNYEVTIVGVRATGPVEKRPDPMGTKASVWRFPVEYQLETGEVEQGSITRSRKRDAVAEYAVLPAPPSHPMRAVYFDGRFVATSTTYGLSRASEYGRGRS